MAEKSVPTQKHLLLLSGRSHPELADQVAENLGIDLTPVTAHDFANGEILSGFVNLFAVVTHLCFKATPRPLISGSWNN